MAQSLNRKIFIVIAAILSIFCFYEIIPAQTITTSYKETVLYDAELGTDPDQQNWLYLSNRLTESNVRRHTEDDIHILDTMADLTETAGYFGNVQQSLNFDRNKGFSFHIELQIIQEYHTSDNRAGFSVILLSEDARGIELAFWEDYIWVYDEHFLKTERFTINTTDRLRRFSVEISGDNYSIFIDDNFALNGPVRDYSDFPMPDNYPNIYGTPNFFFFGNNTSRAASKTAISRVSVQTPSDDSARLFQNAPNPFQNITTIPFYLDTSGHVRLDLFDVTGRHAATLVDSSLEAGEHSVEFNATHLSAGLYFYRLTTNGRVYSKKLMVIR